MKMICEQTHHQLGCHCCACTLKDPQRCCTYRYQCCCTACAGVKPLANEEIPCMMACAGLICCYRGTPVCAKCEAMKALDVRLARLEKNHKKSWAKGLNAGGAPETAGIDVEAMER